MTTKFNLHNVTNGTHTVRVWLSKQTYQGETTVNVYPKEYGQGEALVAMFGADAYTNNSDYMTDLFDKGSITLREGHPLFAAACAAADRKEAAGRRPRRTETAADVVIVENAVQVGGRSRLVRATCGKVAVSVLVYNYGCTVMIDGKTRRLGGKTYRSFKAAVDAYRSPEMKALLTTIAATKAVITLRATETAVAS